MENRKGSQPHNRTTNPFIEKRLRYGHFYAYLRIERGGEALYLGIVPDSPTGLLELALNVASKLTIFELRKLMAAKKSMRV